MDNQRANVLEILYLRRDALVSKALTGTAETLIELGNETTHDEKRLL